MNTFFIALLVTSTTISCVTLGVVSAYGAVVGLLAAFNPSRPRRTLQLVPHQSQAAGGD